MRRFSQNWARAPIIVTVQNAARRWRWFIVGATRGQLANLVLSAARFATSRPTSGRVPVMIKLDISPMCNLSCSFCVHSSADDEALEQQHFNSRQRVDLTRFERLVAEVEGRTSVFALYYVGDPLVHPDLARMCAIAADASIRTHVSTNFSFRLSDDRLRELVESRMSHLTVCVDSMVQEQYEKTRVGGDIELVLSNLERLLDMRRTLGADTPHIEVQYIKFQHNVDQLPVAERWCEARGVDQFTSYWGNLHNYVDLDPHQIIVEGPRSRSWLPRCAWPYFAMTVRFDGETLPCCYHRVSEQYRVGGDDRPIANVFDRSVSEVWSSPAYSSLRRISANPSRVSTRDREASFCHGCDTVERTSTPSIRRRADEHHWEPVRLGRPES